MKGTVAAGHELTARAAVEILEKGGNAFDAAVAAVFASFVCEPAITSAGGGGFFMALDNKGDSKGGGAPPVPPAPVVYDFFSNVPGKGVSAQRQGDAGEKDFFPVTIEFANATQEMLVGRASAAVPGALAGLKMVHERHCRLELTEILEPAIRYADRGVEVNAHQAVFVKILAPILVQTDEGRRVFAPGGKALKAGDVMRNKDMAGAFEYLADKGLDKFYTGEVGRSVAAAFGPASGGLITEEDLSGYAVAVREPVKVGYRGRQVYTNPPPSTGGTLVAFALKLLEGHGEAASLPHNGAEYLRLLVEVMKTVDRARFEEFDGRVYDDGVAEELLSDETVGRYSKTLAVSLAAAASPVSAYGPGSGAGNTTHISVVDSDGGAASVTTSSGFGGGIMVPDTGIMMNNFLGEEDLNPHGYHTQEPGLRISSMMSPVIVIKDGVIKDGVIKDGAIKEGRPELVIGTGGSKRIRNVLVQMLLNLFDHSMEPERAVAEARVHWDGNTLQAEPGIKDAAISELKGAGVDVNMWSDMNVYFGGVSAVCLDASGCYRGAADPRRGGRWLKTN